MIIDTSNLNNLEQNIYHILITQTKTDKALKIQDAANLCGCSVSKISKFVKKIGFKNFHDFSTFLQGKEPSTKICSDEISRIHYFTENFDYEVVNTFLLQFNKYEKIILFGYGPSFYCVQYFEYKLRFNCDKHVVATSDELIATNLFDSNSLLVIFTATGSFASFTELNDIAISKGSKVILIVEEYHPQLLKDYDTVLFLTNTCQSNALKPFEKSRTIFFIFIEEILYKIITNNIKKER